MPQFHVWCPDDEEREDGQLFEACDSEDAAQKWGDWYDVYAAGDYPIASETQTPTVCVQEVGSDEVYKYIVSAFISTTYTTRLVDK
ncbi:hypothetical protein B1757_02720 [Acidithiobacillus marinus]|uniref:Uncharacterized protein n=1 Tax=Acidithiobacillus marinus TaxID=187490 RepID=A0A2I1DPC7_9PROT|nr:hypothetical protein [Acidithiobacillus marinus]PKY11720.1 hypothetical protein B1757_02720 [Acidithiobacillus marinus]